MIDLSLAPRLSLELDGLYRGLRGRYQTGSPFTIVTWNMPLLAEYRLAGAGARIAPFIAAGPSLRFGQVAPHWGATADAGIEARVGPLRISPQLRFTHWNISSSNSITPANQVEIVAAFAGVAKEARSLLGDRAEIGILLGTNLTSDFRSQSFPVLICGGSPVVQCEPATGMSTSASSHFLRGAALRIALAPQWSTELDVIQRYMGVYETTERADGSLASSGTSTISTWQFPVLMRRSLWQIVPLSSFVAAGPSFRLPQMANGGHLAVLGATAAAGLKAQRGIFSLTPSLRFTHWGAGSPPDTTRAIANQVEFMLEVGIMGSRVERASH